MICPKCKREILNNSSVCPFCNTQIIIQTPNPLKANNSGLFEIIERNDNINTSQNTNFAHESSLLSEKESEQSNLLKQDSEEIVPILELDDEESKKDNKEKVNLLLGIIIIIGIIFLIFMLIYIFFVLNKKDNNNNKISPVSKTNFTPSTQAVTKTNNKGRRSTYNYPLQVGKTSLASIYDYVEDTYYEVDVTGIRFIDNLEATQLATTYSVKNVAIDFNWYGFEYKVQFNDLQALNGRKINPALNAKIYKFDGNDFITYNGHNYLLSVYTIPGNETITNNEFATIKVIYQMLDSKEKYSVCLGYRDKTMGCFTKN